MTPSRIAAILYLPLAITVAHPASASENPFEQAGLRANVVMLVNDAQILSGAQALYRTSHGAPAATVAELMADGNMPRPPQGSAIVRKGPDGQATWRIVGTDVEIPLATASLDGPECREAARQAGNGPLFGCAMRRDGIVFRFAY